MDCESADNDFVAIKKGDVVPAYADPLLRPGEGQRTVRFISRDRLLKAGQTFDVDVRVSDFTDLAALQFALRFDTDALAFESLTPQSGFPVDASNFTYFNLDQGEIRAVWVSATPRSASAKATALRLRLTAKADGVRLSEALNIDDEVMMAKAYALDLTGYPIEWIYLPTAAISREDMAGDPAGSVTLVARPNPFAQTLIAGFELPESCEAQVRLLDLQGRVVAEQKSAFVEGYNEVRFRESAEMPAGIYFCELTTPWGVTTQRVIKAKE